MRRALVQRQVDRHTAYGRHVVYLAIRFLLRVVAIDKAILDSRARESR